MMEMKMPHLKTLSETLSTDVTVLQSKLNKVNWWVWCGCRNRIRTTPKTGHGDIRKQMFVWVVWCLYGWT